MFFCVGQGEYELEIKRSRFIASSYRIEGRDDVKGLIAALKARHKDARHVCYGFIADEKGDDFGYDDNGEPSGTAGKPIYSALSAVSARKSLIAVVRYFGGIKLGAGGLTRAYRESAAGLIDSVGLCECEYRTNYSVVCGGDAYKKFINSVRNLCSIERIEYAQNVDCVVSVSDDCEAEFVRAAHASGVILTSLGAKCVPVDG